MSTMVSVLGKRTSETSTSNDTAKKPRVVDERARLNFEPFAHGVNAHSFNQLEGLLRDLGYENPTQSAKKVTRRCMKKARAMGYRKITTEWAAALATVYYFRYRCELVDKDNVAGVISNYMKDHHHCHCDFDKHMACYCWTGDDECNVCGDMDGTCNHWEINKKLPKALQVMHT